MVTGKKRWSIWSWLQAVAVAFFLFGIVFFWFAQWFLHSALLRFADLHELFITSSKRSVWSVAPEFLTGINIGRRQPQPVYRWLILGKDEVAGSNRERVLTDTILLASYWPEQGKVRLLSLPRDVYLPEYSTKINSLYEYGKEYTPRQPSLYPQQVLSELLGIPIDGVVSISLQDLQELIDIADGVTVDVPNTFTDTQFPRSGVDVTRVTDPALLYETVTFTQGTEHMSGERALQYIRSRKGDNPAEANDEARARRQQQVIAALVARFADPQIMVHPGRIGGLYRWYADRFLLEVPLAQVGEIAGAWSTHPIRPEIQSIPLPLTPAPQATGSATLLVHPPDSKYQQWVYELADPSGEQLKTYLQQQGL